MGFISGLFKRILKYVFYLIIIAAFIIFIPNLPPYTKFTRIEIEPSQPRVGALAPNNILNNVEKLYKDKLLGPEALHVWNGEVYTGLATGEIVKVSPGGHVTFVTKIGQPCSLTQEHICGRPLGFVIDEKNKLLYVADAYHGIWRVNLVNNKKQLLVSPRVAIDGRVPRIFNDVALDNNGDLYWTDSSSDFHLRDGVMVLLADPTGRLFHYSFAKNESKVLLDDLWFANGLTISPDNSFILVAESSRYRLIKYYLTGPKKGNSEVFLAGLPGIPDNIRSLPDGSGVLIPLYSVFDDEHPLLVKTAAAVPLARKFLARVLRLIEIPFEFLHSQFPNYIFENIVHMIGSFGSVASLAPGLSGLIQTDWNGNIIAAYYNTDGSVYHISDAVVFNNKLYMGCPHLQNFIAAVPAPPQLIKAFTTPELPKKIHTVKTTPENKPDIEKKVVLETVKPTTPLPPTTTTPKPSQKQPTKHPNDNIKENVKQNKPQEVKPKAATKEAEINKPKENKPKTETKQEQRVEVKNVNETPKKVAKEADIKSKAVPKDTKATVAPKESDTKPKVTPKQTEEKPKLEQKQAEVKTEKIEVDKMSTVNKNQEPETKPVIKEKEDKAKISKEEAKEKTQKLNKETVPTQSDTKTTTKAPEIKNKDKQKPTSSEAKPKKGDKEPVKKATQKAPKTVTKPTPIEEDIPSDTVKPSKETLKVIKKNGPQEIPIPNV